MYLGPASHLNEGTVFSGDMPESAHKVPQTLALGSDLDSKQLPWDGFSSKWA